MAQNDTWTDESMNTLSITLLMTIKKLPFYMRVILEDFLSLPDLKIIKLDAVVPWAFAKTEAFYIVYSS